MLQIFKEFRRRNMFRVAGVYLVVSWLIMQIVAVMTPALLMPDWVDSFFAILLIIGFPIALVLAWAFEITPEGVKPTQLVDPDNSIAHVTGQKLDYAILAGILLVAALLVWQTVRTPNPVIIPQNQMVESTESNPSAMDAQRDINPASIAVLPFADLSQEQDQRYFAEGLSEEILNTLDLVTGLKVASRTSSFSFRVEDELSLPMIARQLAVRHILEGSIRKAGANIRVSVSLIDSETDQQIWSQTFDRVFSTENLFAIQDQIAEEVALKLNQTLQTQQVTTSGNLSRKADTDNNEAYVLYLEARTMFHNRSQKNLTSIIEKYEQAVALDSRFARAWAGLAAAYRVAPSWNIEQDEGEPRDFETLSRLAANRAIGINPDLSLPYAVLALHEMDLRPADYNIVFDNLDRALIRDPDDTTALLWRGIAHVSTGFFDKAQADMKICLEADPEYENCRRWLAIAKLFSGETEEAFRLFEQGLANGVTSNGYLFASAYAAEGDERAALMTLGSWLQGWEPGPDREYRALTDPDFDPELEQKEFEAEFMEFANTQLIWEEQSVAAFGYRKYESLKARPDFPVWWLRTRDDFLKSPHRKRVITENGLPEYWRSSGFPPQCRPVGDDDFECD